MKKPINEFARMQELAGLNEMKLKYDELSFKNK
jgi:hypothetical protein